MCVRKNAVTRLGKPPKIGSNSQYFELANSTRRIFLALQNILILKSSLAKFAYSVLIFLYPKNTLNRFLLNLYRTFIKLLLNFSLSKVS